MPSSSQQWLGKNWSVGNLLSQLKSMLLHDYSFHNLKSNLDYVLTLFDKKGKDWASWRRITFLCIVCVYYICVDLWPLNNHLTHLNTDTISPVSEGVRWPAGREQTSSPVTRWCCHCWAHTHLLLFLICHLFNLTHDMVRGQSCVWLHLTHPK